MLKSVDLRRTIHDTFLRSNYLVVFVDVADSFASRRTSTIKGDDLKFAVDRRRLTASHIGNGDCLSEQPGSSLWSLVRTISCTRPQLLTKRTEFTAISFMLTLSDAVEMIRAELDHDRKN